MNKLYTRRQSYGTAIIEVGRTSDPTKEGHECAEDVNSFGSACRKCDHPTCPQVGFTKAMASNANKFRVLKGNQQ